MEPPNLHLVDDNGKQLNSNIVEAVNQIASAVFGSYSRCDAAEVSNALEDSARVAARRLEKTRFLPNLAGFVWKTARNKMMTSLRSRSREEPVDLDALDSRADVHSDPQRLELEIAVRQAVAHLSERERTILIMKSQNYSGKEIGRHLNMSQRNVDTIACRTRDKLLEMLGPVSRLRTVRKSALDRGAVLGRK